MPKRAAVLGLGGHKSPESESDMFVCDAKQRQALDANVIEIINETT